MGETGGLLKEEEKKIEVVVTTQQEESIRDQLSRMQNWDLAENQTVEQRRSAQATALIERQQERNEQLRARAAEQLPATQATQVAHGTPAQEQAPAQSTHKERKEKARRAKEANKKVPGADHFSYAIQEQLRMHDSAQNNSLNGADRAAMEADGLDLRVMKILCQGHQVNRRGNPVDEDAAQQKAEDLQTMADYASKDLERRRPILQRLTNEVLDYAFSPNMFSEENLAQRGAMLKEMGDKLTYLENIKKDPINRGFFEGLPPEQLKLLENKMSVSAVFGETLTQHMAAKAVSTGTCDYVQGTRQVEAATAQCAQLDGMFAGQIEQVRQAEQEYYQTRLEQRRVELLQGAQEAQELIQRDEELAEYRELDITSYAIGYAMEDLAKYRGMIEGNPQIYAAHKPAIDKLYQEMYRGVDARGDLMLELQANQAVVDNADNESYAVRHRLEMRASNEMDVIAEKIELMARQITSVTDALEYLLKGKQISEHGLDTLRTLGLNAEGDQAQILRDTASGAIVKAASKEKIAEHGQASTHHTLVNEQAQQVVEQSRGFIYAKPVGENLSELRATLPKTIELNGKTLQLRRTYNWMQRAIARQLVDEKGNIPVDRQDFIADLLNGMYATAVGTLEELRGASYRRDMGRFVRKFFSSQANAEFATAEEAEAMLEQVADCLAEIPGYVDPNNNEEPDERLFCKGAALLCPEVLNAWDGVATNMEPDVTLEERQGRVRSRMEGEGAEEADIQKAMKAIKTLQGDIDLVRTGLLAARNFDIDGEAVLLPNACSANHMMVQGIRTAIEMEAAGKQIATGADFIQSEYQVANQTSAHPEIALAFLQKKEIAVDAALKTRIQENIDKKTPITPEDASALQMLVKDYQKYVYHVAATVGELDDGSMITVETFAAETTQYMVCPVTADAAIGLYKGGMEGMKGYYNEDNPLPTEEGELLEEFNKRKMK